MDDIVETLSAINREMNGAVPSETAIADAKVSRRLAYAVSELQRMLRVFRESTNVNEVQQSARTFERTIESAWLAVLSGDIDDIREHIAGDLAAE
ncbi:MAG TPA: hypothetical protein VKE95_18965 [Burkholderiales bacterium]|nr:hypothetical protein [Burkholderiales bacterium]